MAVCEIGSENGNENENYSHKSHSIKQKTNQIELSNNDHRDTCKSKVEITTTTAEELANISKKDPVTWTNKEVLFWFNACINSGKEKEISSLLPGSQVSDVTIEEKDWLFHVREYGEKLEWLVMDCIYEKGQCAKPLRRKLRFLNDKKLPGDGDDVLLFTDITDINELKEPFTVYPDRGIDKMKVDIKNKRVNINIIQIKLGASRLAYSQKGEEAKNEKAYHESINGFIGRLKTESEEIVEAIKMKFKGLGYTFVKRYILYCTRQLPESRDFFFTEKIILFDRNAMYESVWSDRIKRFAIEQNISWILKDE